MTDARMPERWLIDKRFRQLTADEYRTYVVCLIWAVGNRTDGELTSDDLELIPDALPTATPRLVEVGLWGVTATGWLIKDFALTQTSRAQLEGLELKKRQDADRARVYRGRKNSERHVIPSRDDLGQDKTGQAKAREGHSLADASRFGDGSSLTSEYRPDERDCTNPSCNGRLTDVAIRRGQKFCNQCSQLEQLADGRDAPVRSTQSPSSAAAWPEAGVFGFRQSGNTHRSVG